MSELEVSDVPEPMPPIQRGFEHIRRFWDRSSTCWMAKILPGEYYVTREAEGISTVLGSCVSACLRDPVLRVGGMNHFMLPEDTSSGRSSWMAPDVGLSTRYGAFAMEVLINELLKLGARRERIEIKLFGGGRMLASMTDVGARNIDFVRHFIGLEGFRVVAEDLGGEGARRVVFFPATGRVRVKRLRTLDNQEIASRERQYLDRLVARSGGQDVELFDTPGRIGNDDG